MEFYRGKDCQGLEDELKEIMEQAQNNQDAPNDICGHFQALASKRFLRPFLCVGVIYTLFHLSGFNIISGTYTHFFLEVYDINKEILIVTLLFIQFIFSFRQLQGTL